MNNSLYIAFSNSTVGLVRNVAENYGEVHNWKDQMPGSTSTTGVFSGAPVYSGGWLNFGGPGHNDERSWWGNYYPTTTEEFIWDKRCSS